MKALIRIAGVGLVILLLAASLFYYYPLQANDGLIRYHLWRANVRSEYVTAGSYRLHYFEAVPPDGSPGVPLVLVHGLGARSEDWSPMIPGLAAAGFHVYVPDLLGYGRSAKPAVAYSIPLEEGVVVDFMQAIHLSRADVGGWSMGGWVAGLIALDHPEMVDRLVLYDAAGITYQISFPRDAFVPTDPAGLGRLIALLTPKPLDLPPFVVRATLRKIKKQGPIVQQTLDEMLTGADVLDQRLPSLQQPTAIIWGTEDKLIPISVGETMHHDIPNSDFEGIAGCGHLAPGECPIPVLAATIEFLKSQPPLQNVEKMFPGSVQGGAKPETEGAK